MRAQQFLAIGATSSRDTRAQLTTKGIAFKRRCESRNAMNVAPTVVSVGMRGFGTAGDDSRAAHHTDDGDIRA